MFRALFTSEENINAIQVLQNKCIRIMTFAPYNSNVDQSFLDLKLLKVSEVIKSHQLKVTYDFHDKHKRAHDKSDFE